MWILTIRLQRIVLCVFCVIYNRCHHVIDVKLVPMCREHKVMLPCITNVSKHVSSLEGDGSYQGWASSPEGLRFLFRKPHIDGSVGYVLLSIVIDGCGILPCHPCDRSALLTVWSFDRKTYT